MKKFLLLIFCLVVFQVSFAQHFFTDPERAYSSPSWQRTHKGELILSWLEKEKDGKSHLCMAISKDNGKTFSNKSTIASGYGIGSSRLSKAKVLSKKDGKLVAVFMNNPAAQAGKPSRGGQVFYCLSTDQGASWSVPAAVDQDPTPGLMRGFFDAAVLANDEIAVVYLKDVKGSTKHEERDLRISITKNGTFQEEKLIDPVVCDCCNIGLMVDSKGVLNVYYRDNKDDIRDFSHISSKDNGLTFTAPKNIYKDNWQIAGCPHNGAYPVEFKKQNYIAWFTGSDTDRGIKVVSQDGRKITTPNVDSAKNFGITADTQQMIFFWEQTNAISNHSQVAYQLITENNVSSNKLFNISEGASNPVVSLIGDKALIAYEIKVEGKPIIKVDQVNL